MPAREVYDQNDGTAQVGVHSLLGFIGQSKSLTAGWTGFAIKSLMVSVTASTVFGATSWMLFQGPLGPCLSFLAGSGFGFIGGLVSRWRTDSAEAVALAEKYPLLIEHHVRVGEAWKELQGTTFSEWSHDLRGNPRKIGHVIAAMYSAAPALERIHQEQEDALVTAYATRDAATATAAVEGTADGEA